MGTEGGSISLVRKLVSKLFGVLILDSNSLTCKGTFLLVGEYSFLSSGFVFIWVESSPMTKS